MRSLKNVLKKYTSKKPIIVLVDMDGVLADFEKHALKLYREMAPSYKYIPLDRRRGHCFGVVLGGI